MFVYNSLQSNREDAFVEPKCVWWRRDESSAVTGDGLVDLFVLLQFLDDLEPDLRQYSKLNNYRFNPFRCPLVATPMVKISLQ